MSISKKYKRKIIYNNNEYFWYVAEDYDGPLFYLHIVSIDKSLIIYVPLDSKIPYIKVNGKRVPFSSDIPKAITPKFVTNLIDWARSRNL